MEHVQPLADERGVKISIGLEPLEWKSPATPSGWRKSSPIC